MSPNAPSVTLRGFQYEVHEPEILRMKPGVPIHAVLYHAQANGRYGVHGYFYYSGKSKRLPIDRFAGPQGYTERHADSVTVLQGVDGWGATAPEIPAGAKEFSVEFSDPGSQRAFLNCQCGERLPDQQSVTLSPSLWPEVPDASPLLGEGRWYFSTHTQSEPGVYFQQHARGNLFNAGKPNAQYGQSVVQLASPDPVLSKIQKNQHRISQLGSKIFAIAHGNLSSKVLRGLLLLENEPPFIRPAGYESLSLFSPSLYPVTEEVHPAALSVRVLSYFEFLHSVLQAFLLTRSDFKHEGYNYQVHETTDFFYEIVHDPKSGSQHKLRPQFVAGEPLYKLEVPRLKSFVFPIQLGTDFPTRNALKRLESHQPSTYLLTWEDGDFIAYAGVIVTQNGDNGIWCSHFASRLVQTVKKKPPRPAP